MHTRRKASAVLVVLTLVVLAAALPAAAKEYYFPEVRLDITVREDGGFDVVPIRCIRLGYGHKVIAKEHACHAVHREYAAGER